LDETAGETNNLVQVDTNVNTTNVHNSVNLFSGSEDDNEGLWTTVQRRRTPSPKNSKKTARKSSSRSKKARILDKELAAVVNEAENSMTPAEKDKISRRNTNVKGIQHERSPSREEGTSKLKGKAVDPCNWGNGAQENLRGRLRACACACMQLRALNKSLHAMPISVNLPQIWHE